MHHHLACRVLGLMACSGPINIQEVFWGLVFGIVSNIIDIS